jgi:hypothetical protein
MQFVRYDQVLIGKLGGPPVAAMLVFGVISGAFSRNPWKTGG